MTDNSVPSISLSESIARLRRAMRKAARAADPQNSLSVAQLELLSALIESPGRPGQLAKRLHLRPNSVTTLVNNLVMQGMLVRDRDKHDRRAVSLAVTITGRAAVDKWRETNAGILDTALRQLPVSARRQLTAAAPALESVSVIIDKLADSNKPDARKGISQ